MSFRFFDILFSSISLILLAPFFSIIIIVLKFTGEGKVFFSQNRVGKDRKNFKILKFVTMLQNSPNIGSKTITVKNDPRVLPFGKLLRKTKINELPQLINILFGDMSFIGPRPLTTEVYSLYPEHIKFLISSVRPGLSGLGSIIFRNEEDIIIGHKNKIDLYAESIIPYKGELEKWYISNSNIKIYFVLIFFTLWVIFFPKSKLLWYVFKTLPKPDPILASTLK